MKRLTNKKQRQGGIPHTYWSWETKETVVQRLGQYEDTGLEPGQIEALKELAWNRPDRDEYPPDGLRVLCLTQTKAGKLNQVIGYYMEDSERWACGMNTNVVRWRYLPEPPRELVKEETAKPKEVDAGTAQALRDAGWTPAAIADELKTTVKKILAVTHEPAARKQYEHEWEGGKR